MHVSFDRRRRPETRYFLVLLVLLLVGPVVVQAEDDPDHGGWSFSALLDARLRYEHSDDDAATREANALTLRTRLGLQATSPGFGVGFLEFEDVTDLGNDHYDSTANGMGAFAVIADPEATEVNRLWWSYAAPQDIALKLGRQRIVRDRGRIIGNVGWRQNEQTFDALTAGRDKGRFRFWAGYLAQANRIFGDQHPIPVNSEYDLDAWVGEGGVQLKPGALTVIAHYLEFENDMLRSHRNLGLRWLGSHELEDGREITYRAEWIGQEPHADGAVTNDADYLAMEFGYGTKKWGVGANAEKLGGDGVYGFQRPLATLHAYNGWADRFLNTPAEGLVDVFLNGRVNFKGCKLSGQWHQYDSDEGSIDFGNEIGLAVAHTFHKRFDVMLKYASFSAGDVGADVQKIWLQVHLGEKFKLR